MQEKPIWKSSQISRNWFGHVLYHWWNCISINFLQILLILQPLLYQVPQSNSDLNWQYVTSRHFSIEKSKHMYQEKLSGSLKLYQLMRVNQVQTSNGTKGLFFFICSKPLLRRIWGATNPVIFKDWKCSDFEAD